jgi:hypothetical protein
MESRNREPAHLAQADVGLRIGSGRSSAVRWPFDGRSIPVRRDGVYIGTGVDVSAPCEKQHTIWIVTVAKILGQDTQRRA